MKPGVRYLMALAAVVALAGCDWEAYNEESGWIDNGYSWVNFSGMYRPAAGNIVVIDPAHSTGTTASTADGRTVVTDQVIAYGNGSNTVMFGDLGSNVHDVVPGTLGISGGGFTFTDLGNGILTGTASASGTVQYATGLWMLDFHMVAPDAGTVFIANYSWLATVPGSDTVTTNAVGNSGNPINMINISQTGNRLIFTDSNGDVYEGYLIDIRSTTGGNGVAGTAKGNIFAEYTVTGRGTRANVTITGSLLGVYDPGGTTFDTTATSTGGSTASSQASTAAAGSTIGGNTVGENAATPITIPTFTSRTLTGTWSEHDAMGGVTRTGDVIGVADRPITR